MFRREGPKVSECARWTRVFACRFRCRSWLLTVLCGGRTRGVIRLNETEKEAGGWQSDVHILCCWLSAVIRFVAVLAAVFFFSSPIGRVD